MVPRTDLTLYDRHGRPRVAVEVRHRRGTTSDWAAKLRRNLLAHGDLAAADYFLMVTPDRFYLWQGAGTALEAIPPTYDGESRSFFAPYLERAGIDPETVSRPAFELTVAAWLGDLMRAGRDAQIPERLEGSDLLAAIRDGRLKYDLAA